MIGDEHRLRTGCSSDSMVNIAHLPLRLLMYFADTVSAYGNQSHRRLLVSHNHFWERIMYRLATAILFLSSPVLAQNNDVLRDCSPIGQTGKGEMVYSLDCKAIKAETADVNYKPKMPSTTMKESVIPKSGAAQNPADTSTTGVNK
jgi:hypothetical protein